MSRRAILRAIGLGAGAAMTGAGRAARAAAAAEEPVREIRSMQLFNNTSVFSDSDNKWNLVQELTRPSRRVQERRSRVAGMLGGYPPHIASCHSWAPWFRAHRATVWAMKYEEEAEGIFVAFRKKVFGE